MSRAMRIPFPMELRKVTPASVTMAATPLALETRVGG